MLIYLILIKEIVMNNFLSLKLMFKKSCSESGKHYAESTTLRERPCDAWLFTSNIHNMAAAIFKKRRSTFVDRPYGRTV